MFEVLVGQLLKAFSGVVLLWGDSDIDHQNSMIDKAAALEARADKCHQKPREFDGFVITMSERLPWVEPCVPA